MFDDAGDLQELYQQVILDHGRNPRNFRELADPDGKAEGYNPLCGDQVTVYCKIEGDKLGDVCFKGRGCAICTASASMMTQAVKNLTRAEADALFKAFHDLVTGQCEDEFEARESLGKLAVFAGVRKYPIRVKCASLAWHTLQAALIGGDTVTTE